MVKVKCEDCGRTLEGPERRCDVCGGKMTIRAAESYFTPEGPIRKSKYDRRIEKTPDRDSKTKTNRPKFGTEKKTTLTNQVSQVFQKQTTGKSFEDIFEKFKKIGSTGLIIIIALGLFFFTDLFNESEFDLNDPDDFQYLEVDESASNDTYDISFTSVDFYFDSEYSGTYDSVDLYCDFEYKGDAPVTISAFDCFEGALDDMDLDISAVSIENLNDENYTRFSVELDDNDTYVLKPNEPYYINIEWGTPIEPDWGLFEFDVKIPKGKNKGEETNSFQIENNEY